MNSLPNIQLNAHNTKSDVGFICQLKCIKYYEVNSNLKMSQSKSILVAYMVEYNISDCIEK